MPIFLGFFSFYFWLVAASNYICLFKCLFTMCSVAAYWLRDLCIVCSAIRFYRISADCWIDLIVASGLGIGGWHLVPMQFSVYSSLLSVRLYLWQLASVNFHASAFPNFYLQRSAPGMATTEKVLRHLWGAWEKWEGNLIITIIKIAINVLGNVANVQCSTINA